ARQMDTPPVDHPSLRSIWCRCWQRVRGVRLPVAGASWGWSAAAVLRRARDGYGAESDGPAARLGADAEATAAAEAVPAVWRGARGSSALVLRQLPGGRKRASALN